ncbi:MAG TPA: hypothetical protein VIX86_03175 [Streptosporangiaceae bacterium]
MTGRAAAGRFRVVPLLALLVAAATLVLLAGCAVLLYLTRDYTQAVYGSGGTVAALVACGTGLLVAGRQPGNPIGWLLLGWAAVVAVVGAGRLYSVLDYRIHAGALPLGQTALLLQEAAFVVAICAGLIVALFPDGRLPSRRWWWLLGCYCAAGAVFTIGQLTRQAAAISGPPVRVYPTGVPVASPPLAGAAAVVVIAGQVAGWLVLAGLLVFTGRQGADFRRSTGLRRQQLRLVLTGAACCAVATAITIFARDYSYGTAQVVQSAADLGAAALPVGIAVGIARYRLYDLGRIISRTLAYTIVTGLLAGIYAGLVVLATQVLPVSSPVAVAGATLVVVGLFTPLRRGVQRVVDRRFNRARYNAERTVAAFAAGLTESVDLEAVRAGLLAAVQQSLEPAHASIWLADRPS